MRHFAHMSVSNSRPRVWLLAFALIAGACQRVEESGSDTLVTDVEHSSVKRQSIGNCWLYAMASWAESLHKQATGDEINASESFWTWWHWYGEIVDSRIKEINEGGSWYTASRIVLEHGIVLEETFIESEAELEMSNRQAEALEYVNEALAEGGELEKREDRTPENVRRVLDLAFQTDMAKAEKTAIPANEFVVRRGPRGGEDTIDSYLGYGTKAWQEVSFPQVYGKKARVRARQQRAREELFRRAMRALNDRHPVVLSVMIDFNALDSEDATFKVATLREAGEAGDQGGHLVPLEDYVVDKVPGIGTIGEGDVSDELKQAALKGQLRYFKAKNSWGTDRAERGLTDGYTNFQADYLTYQLEWKNERTGTSTWYAATGEFILPPGY